MVATDSAGQTATAYLTIEVLTPILGTSSADSLTGTAARDALYGYAGSDLINGGAGADFMYGGTGNDIYTVDDSDDLVVEMAGEGNDLVKTSVNHRLANNIERLTMTGSSSIYGFGNDLDNTITGNNANNELGGGDGNDTLIGNGGNDDLYGDDGNDTLNGGGGSDYMVGGEGNDTFFVSSTGDEVDEWEDEGTDTVKSSISYVLGTNVENLTLSGSGALSGSGNEIDNILVGNNGANTLRGLEGNDTLKGGSGNDTLEGGLGRNTMIGGLGGDSYVYGGGQDTIDNTGGGNDGVFFNDGIDASRLGFSRDGDDLLITDDLDPARSVRVTNHFLGGDSAIDYVQPDGGPMLDAAAINILVDGGSGGVPGGDPGGGTDGGTDGGTPGDDSDYPNVVEGTVAGEQLLGSNGRDLMRGLDGDDTLFAFQGDDKLEGGDGNDDLYGGNGSFSGSGNDILIGGAGSDSLKGEDGDDLLLGGAGDDSYYYAAGSGSDTIDNTGGGSDYIYFASIARERLSFHREGDDLIVRVDSAVNQQTRVLKHFQGGQFAIAFVQPGDGGYGIPASQFDSLLTPQSGTTSMSMGGNAQVMQEFIADSEVADVADSASVPAGKRLGQATNWRFEDGRAGRWFNEPGADLPSDSGSRRGELDYLFEDGFGKEWSDRFASLDFGERLCGLGFDVPIAIEGQHGSLDDRGIQMRPTEWRMDAPVSCQLTQLAETNRELARLVGALSSYSSGAMTAHPDRSRGGPFDREFGWGAISRDFDMRGSERMMTP